MRRTTSYTLLVSFLALLAYFVGSNLAHGADNDIVMTQRTATGQKQVILTDPGTDRLIFWRESVNEPRYLTLGSGLSIIGSTITSSGSSVWGGITGTLSDQTDLQNALNLKLGTSAAAAAYQPLDSDLTSIAALSTTSFGRGLLTLTAYPTFNQSTTGNAATATALATARTINGTSFDGTGNITVTAAAGTLTGSTLASGVTASSLTSFGSSATLITPSISGAITFPDDVLQTFNPGTTNAGLNVGSLTGDPSAPSNGSLWYDSIANELTARINGSNVALGAGGGGGIGGSTGSTNTALLVADGTGGATLKATGVKVNIFNQLIMPANSAIFCNETATLSFGTTGVSNWWTIGSLGTFTPYQDGTTGSYPPVIGSASKRLSQIFVDQTGIKLGNGTNGPTVTASGTSPNESLVLTSGGTGIVVVNNITGTATVPSGKAGLLARSGELYALDSAGNETLISPHSPTAPAALYRDGVPSRDENISYSANYFQGVVTYQNRDTGKVYRETFAEHNTRLGLTGDQALSIKDWDVVEAAYVAESQANRAEWDAVRAEWETLPENRREEWPLGEKPALYVAKAKPDWATDQSAAIAAERAVLPDAKRYQLLVWLIRNGLSPDSVPDIIRAAIPAGPARDEALVRWESVELVPADHPLVALVAADLGVTVSEVWPDIIAIK